MRPHPALTLVPLVLAACGAAVEPAATIARSLGATIDPARPAVDPNHGGDAPAIAIAEVSWGRLVDVYAVDPERAEPVLVAEDLVVGPEVDVDTDPLTGITSVTVIAPIGTSAFDAAWEELQAGLVPIAEKSLDPRELPPFPTVPRDAAIVVRFDDLLDPATVNGDSIRLSVGTPPVQTFSARVLVDRHHPTRVILDTTTSRVDALGSAEPTALNPIGLPPSGNPVVANVALTVTSAVRNAAGNGGREVVRAMRSGSRDDVNHGLLADLVPPRVVGAQVLALGAIVPDPQGGPQDYLVDVSFPTLGCERALRTRDVLSTPMTVAVVTADSASPVGGAIPGVHVRVVAGPAPSGVIALWEAVYRPAVDAGREACFVRFAPDPTSPPATGVHPEAVVFVRFSEPMDASSVSGLETFTIAPSAAPVGPRERVAARAIGLLGSDQFALTPELPLDHAAGASETYFLVLGSGPDGPKDLAGNPLRDPLPIVPFHLDPAAPARESGNYVLRFDSTDEDVSGRPELRGQFLHDLAEGAILPRPVARFSAVADRTQTVPALMNPLPFGVRTPLSNLGSRTHAIWRCPDVGFGLLDESFVNVDVEGLDWAPIGGSVVFDQYAQFEISLAHSRFLPDEVLDPVSLLPEHPASGLVTTFAQNQLDPIADPLRVVHPRQRGYTVSPADVFVSTTGTPMMPWPLNRNLPADQHVYYTWRDTAVDARGAPNGAGAELGIVVQATGVGTVGVPFPPGQVPTIGLPLLMEFKCFPDAVATGLNSLDASLAINSSPDPRFRAFSSGGMNQSGQLVTIDPDAATVATGGFSPSSTPPGLPTPPVDNLSYIGQIDLVVRVSRLHTVWIDTRYASPTFAQPVVEPHPAEQPPGTQVVFAFRGATAATPLVQRDASALDAYGNGGPGSVSFLAGDPGWKSSIAQIAGARFVQVRASFVSNAATGLEPRMTALGVAFSGP